MNLLVSGARRKTFFNFLKFILFEFFLKISPVNIQRLGLVEREILFAGSPGRISSNGGPVHPRAEDLSIGIPDSPSHSSPASVSEDKSIKKIVASYNMHFTAIFSAN